MTTKAAQSLTHDVDIRSGMLPTYMHIFMESETRALRSGWPLGTVYIKKVGYLQSNVS